MPLAETEAADSFRYRPLRAVVIEGNYIMADIGVKAAGVDLVLLARLKSASAPLEPVLPELPDLVQTEVDRSALWQLERADPNPQRPVPVIDVFAMLPANKIGELW